MDWAYDQLHLKYSDHERAVTFFKENFDAEGVDRLEENGVSVVALNIGGVYCNFSP
jgi:hypothetical protein